MLLRHRRRVIGQCRGMEDAFVLRRVMVSLRLAPLYLPIQSALEIASSFNCRTSAAYGGVVMGRDAGETNSRSQNRLQPRNHVHHQSLLSKQQTTHHHARSRVIPINDETSISDLCNQAIYVYLLSTMFFITNTRTLIGFHQNRRSST
jgi:hypothetical protein